MEKLLQKKRKIQKKSNTNAPAIVSSCLENDTCDYTGRELIAALLRVSEKPAYYVLETRFLFYFGARECKSSFMEEYDPVVSSNYCYFCEIGHDKRSRCSFLTFETNPLVFYRRFTSGHSKSHVYCPFCRCSVHIEALFRHFITVDFLQVAQGLRFHKINDNLTKAEETRMNLYRSMLIAGVMVFSYPLSKVSRHTLMLLYVLAGFSTILPKTVCSSALQIEMLDSLLDISCTFPCGRSLYGLGSPRSKHWILGAKNITKYKSFDGEFEKVYLNLLDDTNREKCHAISLMEKLQAKLLTRLELINDDNSSDLNNSPNDSDTVSERGQSEITDFSDDESCESLDEEVVLIDLEGKSTVPNCVALCNKGEEEIRRLQEEDSETINDIGMAILIKRHFLHDVLRVLFFEDFHSYLLASCTKYERSDISTKNTRSLTTKLLKFKKEFFEGHSVEQFQRFFMDACFENGMNLMVGFLSRLLSNDWVIVQSDTSNGTISFSEKMYIEFIFDTVIRGLVVFVQNEDGPQAVIFGKEYVVRMSSSILHHMPSSTQTTNIFDTSFGNNAC